MYHTDGSKFEVRKVGCAFLLRTRNGIVDESQLLLTQRATIFAPDVLAIKEAISEALQKGLGELDIFSDSKSVLQALCSLVPRHRVVAEIRNLIKGIGIGLLVHCIRAHIGYACNERAGQSC